VVFIQTPVRWIWPEKFPEPTLLNSNRSSLPSKKTSEIMRWGSQTIGRIIPVSSKIPVAGTVPVSERIRSGMNQDWSEMDVKSPDNEWITSHEEAIAEANSSPVSTCVNSCQVEEIDESFWISS
jgi:hypothetical protein